MKDKFVWGKVIERFEFDFDGVVLNVVKYHPRALEKDGSTLLNGVYTDDVLYSCEEMSQSFSSMFELIVHWLTYKQFGLNNGSLAQGLCRAIEL